MTDEEIRAQLRSQIRADLIRCGLATGAADEALDLAFHSADSAMQTLWTVSERASSPAWANAYSLALQFIALFAQARLAELQAKCTQHGVRTGNIQVSVG